MSAQTKFKGAIVNLSGTLPKVGDKAKDFILSRGDLSAYRMSDNLGKRLLLNIFPSLDTPTCATSVRKFNALAGQMKNTQVLCISKDLPFAQSRFCAAEGIENVIALSDFRYHSDFGESYGVVMKDGVLNGLFARVIIIIDEHGVVQYSAITDEISAEPDYDSALSVLR